jgi:hypothetical protein
MRTTRKLAFRTMSMVVATFLAVAVTAGPADAQNAKPTRAGMIQSGDTGWDKV